MSETRDPVAEYLDMARSRIDELLRRQLPAIHKAGDLVAEAIRADALIHVFGSGHSHMLAEELFYRAGGLAAVDPILYEDLMLHRGAAESTVLERVPGRGAEIFSTLTVTPGDVLIVASNSGGNVVAADLARAAREVGMPVVAILSLRHAHSAQSFRGGASVLESLADVVIDNGGVAGDAAVSVPGVAVPMGPTSSVVGAAIVNAIAIRAAARAAELAVDVGVFGSSNMAGGDQHNRALIERYRDRVACL